MDLRRVGIQQEVVLFERGDESVKKEKKEGKEEEGLAPAEKVVNLDAPLGVNPIPYVRGPSPPPLPSFSSASTSTGNEFDFRSCSAKR